MIVLNTDLADQADWSRCEKSCFLSDPGLFRPIRSIRVRTRQNPNTDSSFKDSLQARRPGPVTNSMQEAPVISTCSGSLGTRPLSAALPRAATGGSALCLREQDSP